LTMKTRLYPRATLRRIIKAHQPHCVLSKNTDVMIYLDYLLFLNRLATESSMEATRSGERILEARHVRAVLERTLQEFRG